MTHFEKVLCDRVNNSDVGHGVPDHPCRIMRPAYACFDAACGSSGRQMLTAVVPVVRASPAAVATDASAPPTTAPHGRILRLFLSVFLLHVAIAWSQISLRLQRDCDGGAGGCGHGGAADPAS